MTTPIRFRRQSFPKSNDFAFWVQVQDSFRFKHRYCCISDEFAWLFQNNALKPVHVLSKSPKVSVKLRDGSFGHTTNVNRLQRCLSEIHAWFCHNGLALNADKSDVIIVGTRQQLRRHADLTQVNAAGAGTQVAVSDSTRILDKDLTFDDHFKSVCKNVCYHIRALRHIRPMLTEDIAKCVACSLVNARLDYANSVLFRVISKNTLSSRWRRTPWSASSPVYGVATTSR